MRGFQTVFQTESYLMYLGLSPSGISHIRIKKSIFGNESRLQVFQLSHFTRKTPVFVVGLPCNRASAKPSSEIKL